MIMRMTNFKIPKQCSEIVLYVMNSTIYRCDDTINPILFFVQTIKLSFILYSIKKSLYVP